MERRREEDVEGWPTRPIDGGYDGLRQLAAADFSGAVRARGSTLFMLNGRIVGVFDGTIEEFDGASGTAHKAPHPSLPLLYAMQETGGETRGKYYTNDTPISEVDGTLSEGSFTGYVELSENVLSGDYYQVYHAGRGMSVAFVGTSERLLTGDEAFERADDEVGIYEVRDVDLDVRDVPREDDGGQSDDGTETAADRADDGADDDASDVGDDSTDASGDPPVDDRTPEQTASETPGDADAEGGGGAAKAAGSDAAADVEDATPSTSSATQSTADVDGDAEEPEPPNEDPEQSPTEDPEQSSAADPEQPPIDEAEPSRDAESVNEPDSDAPRSTGSDQVQSAASRSDPTAGETTASTSRQEPGSGGSDDDGGASDSASDPQRSDAVAAEPSAGASGASVESGATGGSGTAGGSGAAGGSGTAGGRGAAGGSGAAGERGGAVGRPSLEDATVVPSLDPDRSAEPTAPPQSNPTADVERAVDGRSVDPDAVAASAERSPDGVDAAFDQEILEREDRIDRLQQRVSNLQDERDELAGERDSLAGRVEELEAENEELQAELRQLEREIEELEAGGADAGERVEPPAEQDGPVDTGPRAALEATDLFVRSDSKGRPTLDDVAGGADAAEVNDNLRLDLHTRFDADQATVDGEPFREFLADTMAYRFVDWLVRELPYEIRDTGQEAAMRDCFDALPEVDRVEFYGAVELTYEEDGETVQAEEPFDVVVRDRMGETLFVADLNDSRDPADAGMLVDLQSGATRVKEHTNVLAGAFAVTRSFFDPDALETAAEATSGSLLSRDSRKSYVKVSRKSGYHLCLVEAREGNLHLNVPEL